jgi:predicted TIM-barrel fold metal-dependent hydrolase
MARWFIVTALGFVALLAASSGPKPPPPTTHQRLLAHLRSVPAIDTHDHLWPFEKLPGFVETERGKGMNLAGLWRNSYYTWVHPLTPWKPGGKFDDWWAKAKHDFADARTTSFYRYQAIAFKDLYGVDFDTITDEQARDLDRRVWRNYLDRRWLYEVVTEKANIELMLNDPYWARFAFQEEYPFAVQVLNVTTLPRGFHAGEFTSADDDPYAFAKKHGLKLDSLDDYLRVLDRLFTEAKAKGCVGLKTTLAYQRTLLFEKVPRERAAKAFGKRRSELSPEEVKAFEDFVMWQLAGLSAKHDLPFQIHTGDARLQGSSPMLLLDLIEGNPKTRFALFHGGYPWVSETAAIVMRHRNVWIDSCWLPTISATMARRAFHEWLDVAPSNRILWGADCNHAEGIYGATELTRRVLAEVLAERVERGDATEEDARRIGRQVLRENALALFGGLKARLWKHRGRLTPAK